MKRASGRSQGPQTGSHVPPSQPADDRCVPDVRDQFRRDSGPLSGIPDVRRLLGEPWHLEAACRDEADENLFFYEPGWRDRLDSASLLLPMLICSDCPVRRPCLDAALSPPVFNVRDDDPLLRTRCHGVWGGSTEIDRVRVQDLPPDDAADALERTFNDRLEARITAYTQERARPRIDGDGVPRPRSVRKRDKRIAEILAKREKSQAKTHHAIGSGKPGPGRGHLGSAGRYAGIMASASRRRGAGCEQRLSLGPSSTEGEAMRGVWVRYRDGSTDEWEVKEAMDLKGLVDAFRHRFYAAGQLSFAVSSEGGLPTDYAIVGLNLADVVSWQVLGLSNPEEEAALWAELQSLGGDDEA
jgi:hypothetical protein